MSQAQEKVKSPPIDLLVKRAQFYEERGNYERAEKILCKTISLIEERKDIDRIFFAESLHNAGLLNICLDELSKAREFLRRALAIRVELLGRDHPDSLDTYDALTLAESERLGLIS